MNRIHGRGAGKAMRAVMLCALLGAALCLPAQAQDMPLSVAPEPARGPDEAVRRLYTLPDPDFAAFDDPARRPDHYTPKIVRRAGAMEACYRQKYGQDWMNFNFLVPGQDYDIRNVRVGTQSEGRRTAIVHVEFFNGDFDGDKQISLIYHMRKIDGRWLVDDVVYAGASFARVLTGSC